MRLTPATISEKEKEKRQLSDITALDFRSSAVSYIEDISVCVQLTRLNLSNNALKSLESIKALQYLPSLKWLDLSHNALEGFEPLLKLKTLNVLTLSHNKIACLPFGLSALSSLQALMLNHNALSSCFSCSECPISLNTLIISNNNIQELKGINHLHGLRKLQAAHNQLRALPSDMSKPSLLAELRLNNNRLCSLQSVSFPPGINILDLGNNLLQDWTALEPVFAFRCLKSLNLKGNPICAIVDYPTRLLSSLKLASLDGRPSASHSGSQAKAEPDSKAKDSAMPQHGSQAVSKSDHQTKPAAQPKEKSSKKSKHKEASILEAPVAAAITIWPNAKRKIDTEAVAAPTSTFVAAAKKKAAFSVLDKEEDLLSADHVLRPSLSESRSPSGLVKVIEVTKGKSKAKPKQPRKDQKKVAAAEPASRCMEKATPAVPGNSHATDSVLGLPSWD